MKITLLFIAACLSSLLSFSQTRDCDPVVANGTEVTCIQGFSPSDLVGFKYNTTDGWVQIPIQIDERILLDVSAPYGEDSGCGGGPDDDEPWDVLYYADPTSHVGTDPVATFDADDELVFMAKDVGEQAGSITNPAGVSNRCELEIYDPLDANILGYIYLFTQDGSLDQSAGVDYVNYNLVFFPAGGGTAGNTVKQDYIMCYQNEVRNTENSRVVTNNYESGFSARWTEDYMKLKTGNIPNANILDIHQITIDVNNCLRYTETFSSNRGVIVSTIDGPVRAIRSIMGANSGRYNQMSIFFTECQAYYRNDFRVHDATTQDVSSAYDMLDWTDDMDGINYSNEYNTTPVTINGNQDNLNNNELPKWALYQGDQGSIAINASIVKNSNHYTFGQTLQDVVQRKNNAGVAWDAYYDDAGSGATYTCTGDKKAYGSSGWAVYSNQCYDYRYGTPKCDLLNFPNEIVFNRTNYYLPPGITNAGAERYADFVQQPLQVMEVGDPLPVELISFQAKESQDGVLLSWQTASETDNAYFELQRSENGKSFKSIVNIKGHGTSLETHEYTFLDVLPKEGNNYYRLKQVDFDGSFEYSKTIHFEWKNTASSNLKIFPNPTNNELYYFMEDQTSIQAVYIYDAYGKMLLQERDTDGLLELNTLEKGVYILEVQSEKGKFRKRFFKL